MSILTRIASLFRPVAPAAAAIDVTPPAPVQLALPPPPSTESLIQRGREILAAFGPPATPSSTAAAPEAPRIVIMAKGTTSDYSDTGAGYRLTPERLFHYFRMADSGQPLWMLDAFRDLLLKDGHTQGLWNKRLDAVALQDWVWEAPSIDERPATAEFAELFNVHMHATNFGAFIEHLALEPHNGWSYGECAWQTTESGLQLPAFLVPVPSRRFVFDPITFEPKLTTEEHPEGELLRVTASTSWVLAQTMRWDKPTQAGRLRAAAPWMLFKRMSIRELLIFAEKYGIPMTIGQYEKNSGEATRKALVEAIERLGTEGNAVLEEGSTIKVSNESMRALNGDAIHSMIVSIANSEISKIFTGGTLTSDTSGPGSYALGAVHAEGEHRQSLADAKRIQMGAHQIAIEAVRRNGLQGIVSPPELYVAVQPDYKAMQAESQTVKNLTEAGMKLSQRANRRRFNQPAPRDAADELKPPTTGKGNLDGSSSATSPSDA